MPLASDLSFLGIAKEVTPGTGAAASAFIPVTSIKPTDKITYLVDAGMRGSMVKNYGETSGVQVGEFEFGGPVLADTVGWPLAGVLGDVTTTGASAPFSHAMAVKQGQPTTYSLTDFYGITGTNSRQFAGMKFSEVGFKFSAEGLLEYTAKTLGNPSTLVVKPTASFSTIVPIPSWIGTVTIATVAKTIIESLEVTIKRPVTPIHTLDGTAPPYAIFAGPVEVSGKFTAVHEDDSELTRYLTNTQPSFVADFLTGTGATTNELKLTMSKCAYTVGNVVRGKDYVETEISFDGVANSTDVGSTGGFSPIKATVQNAVAASTYV
jgi:hypothetical protein